MPRILGFALLACFSVGLTGCTSKPSATEVAAALKARMNEAGDELDVKVPATTVDDLHCYSREDDKYSCNFTVGVTMSGREQKMAGELIMVRQGEGWTYVKGQALALHGVKQ